MNDSDYSWEKVDDVQTAWRDSKPLLGKFSGTVAGLSEKVTVEAYVAEQMRLDPPESTLIDFEYNGPQQVMFTSSPDGDCEIKYAIFEGNAEDNDKGEDELKKLLTQTYTGVFNIGEAGLTVSKDYTLIAYVKSNTQDKADSDLVSWVYIVNPLEPDDGTGEYVKNTMSEVFTLSKDYEVCWSVDVDNITFTDSTGRTSDGSDELYVGVTQFDLDPDTLDKAKEIYITVISGKDVTRRGGTYTVKVQTSHQKTTSNKTFQHRIEYTQKFS